MTRFILIASCALLFAACSRENTVTVTPAPLGASVETIYIATQQVPSAAGEVFARDRTEAPSFASADVAIPSGYQAGDVLDDFVMTSYAAQTQESLIAAMAAAPGDEILVFVHGYNTTTSEAAFRFAQMTHDLELEDAASVFSWASAGAAGAYVYDRDSVLFARDSFAQYLAAISRASDKQIVLVAHSIGAQLALEGMRQLALTGDQRTLADIGNVVLLSPDVDPDIFRRQVDVIGPRPTPYVVLTSGTDRALRLSSLLIGGRAKVGQLNSSEDVRGLDVVFIDLTAVSTGQQFGHLEAATSPSAIALLRDLAGSRSLANHPLLVE